MNAYIFAWLGSALTIYCYVPYFLGLYQKKLKPHVFSWFIWGLLTAIAYAAQLASGGGVGSWIMGLSAMFCFVIAALALRYGEKTITRSDWITFIFALLSIPLWVATKDPFWSVVLITMIDSVAFWPTFRKSWHKPQEESVQTFAIAAVKFVLSIAALENINWTTTLYPASLILMNTLFVMMVVWRRYVLKKQA